MTFTKGHPFYGELHPENLVPGYRGPLGDGHYRAKLTDEDVLEIRRMARSGVSQRSIARYFEIGQTQVWRILRRRSWRHLEEVVPS